MAERCKLLTLTLLLSLVCQERVQFSDSAGAGEIAQKLVKAHSNWTRMSSPGASIEANEVQRQGSAVQYHFFVRGLPADSFTSSILGPSASANPPFKWKELVSGKMAC
jgi:hypothetical protein